MQQLYSSILFTHDGSKLSNLAIAHVASLASTFGAHVYVLQVVDSITQVVTAVNIANVTMDAQEIFVDIAKSERKIAKQNVQTIKDKLEHAGVTKCSTLIRQGDARDEIVKVAKEMDCDLIVMSTHGRSGLKRAFLGSIAEDVVRHAPCPVFLIRAKQDIQSKK